METSSEAFVRNRAAELHTRLFEKHFSIINGKNVDCIKKAFEYQARIQSTLQKPVRGFRIAFARTEDFTVQRPESLLATMFRVIQGKKARRNEFLMNMVNFLDVDITHKQTVTTLFDNV